MIGKLSDEWETPQWLFDALNEEFKFNIDLCATEGNAKCDWFSSDYLSTCIKDMICFMNPPYSNPKPFIEKAWNDAKYNLIVYLVKCETSTKWWGIFWDYENHKAKKGCSIRFFPSRIKYKVPKDYNSNSKCSGPTFPSALIIMDRRQHD